MTEHCKKSLDQQLEIQLKLITKVIIKSDHSPYQHCLYRWLRSFRAAASGDKYAGSSVMLSMIDDLRRMNRRANLYIDLSNIIHKLEKVIKCYEREYIRSRPLRIVYKNEHYKDSMNSFLREHPIEKTRNSTEEKREKQTEEKLLSLEEFISKVERKFNYSSEKKNATLDKQIEKKSQEYCSSEKEKVICNEQSEKDQLLVREANNSTQRTEELLIESSCVSGKTFTIERKSKKDPLVVEEINNLKARLLKLENLYEQAQIKKKEALQKQVKHSLIKNTRNAICRLKRLAFSGCPIFFLETALRDLVADDLETERFIHDLDFELECELTDLLKNTAERRKKNAVAHYEQLVHHQATLLNDKEKVIDKKQNDLDNIRHRLEALEQLQVERSNPSRELCGICRLERHD